MFTRAFALFLAANAGSALAAGTIDFSREIQPILSENCYHCHGPDAKARKAELRLDSKEGVYRTKDGVTVVKPGDSKGSELVTRIFSTDEEEVMPPPKAHRVLTTAQKETLRRWVNEGAQWGEHWAFAAPKRPAVPVAGLAKGTVRNPIDAFVLEKLGIEGLAQAPEASREKLLRRVTLDLTGLPPTPEEMDNFLADNSPGAYERAVDRLLASPRYGERMVWEWLEAARYADTNGYQGDPTRAMWYWRDWAIAAFNQNMPFDKFTIDQIAGDLLPNAANEQLIATGFHRNHMINGEGGRIAEESRVDYVQDRVETTGTVWLGLTFNCCRCHDHKYDPFSQREYYQLSAYFNSIDESGANDAGGLAKPVINLSSPEQEKKIADLDREEKEAAKERDEIEKRLRASQPAVDNAIGGGELREPKWQILKAGELRSENGTVLSVLDDGSIRAGGPSPKTEDYHVTIRTPVGGITAFKLEALPDDGLVNKGPGRSDNGNFVLTEVSLQDGGAPVGLKGASVDFAQAGFSKDGPFDGDQKTGWAIMPEFGKVHTLVFTTDKKLSSGGERALAFRFSFRFGREHTLGRFRISATTDDPALIRPMPESIRRIVAKPAKDRSADEQKELANFHSETNPELSAAKKKAEQVKKAKADFEKTLPRTMVMRERPQPRETFILVKGAYNQFADKVEHGVPAKLAPLPADAPKNRLALAQWLVAPGNPLTARVAINRLWQQFFGTGIVKSVDNFGLQGDPPSNPALLDWLAVEFRESGWDVKRMVRLMVTSATYRQSSRVAPGMAERDPENRLLSRAPRHRLPSWMLRDQALAVSGLLVEKAGGPPVKGYQPAGVWEDATFGQIRFTQDHGEALYRRSLYIFWRRIVAPTMFFDVANRQNCTVKVGLTNTPLHALVTLNDTTFVEAARALGQRTLLAQEPDDSARIAGMFRLCTGRKPLAGEAALLLRRLQDLRQTFAQNGPAAEKLLTVGESKPAAGLAPAELAAWASLGSLILNLDETLSNE